MVLSQADAIHFLRRVGFTAPQDLVDTYTGMSRVDAVDLALDLSARPAISRPPEIDDHHLQFTGFMAFTDWWYDRMVKTSTPLEEKMTLFWHDHFACGQDKVANNRAMWDQQMVFRDRGFGDFETLLWETSISGAMLIYIDNESNVAGAVQENFGREVMELHTVGVGQYDEADVVAMSRAWTGYGIVGWNGSYRDPTYKYRDRDHDKGQKTLFGITRNWDAPDTVTELVNGSKQMDTARLIARKMWKWFAHTNPTDSLVQGLANTFASSGMDCTALLRAILLHDEFWGPKSRNALIRNPVELAVAFYKLTGISDLSEASTWWNTKPMGMILFEPPHVAGWGENEYWISTATCWGRAEFVGNYRWRLTREEHLDGLRGPGGTPIFEDLATLSPAAGVQRMFDTFEIRNPSAATRNHYEAWFAHIKANHPWYLAPGAIQITPLCPDFQVI